ncbi:MAG TPA: hypothetical protein VFI81_10135 [Rhodanobacteraceae bacterium]|nr:hypothetical protein [Rhodanobacteraceae bacterium]
MHIRNAMPADAEAIAAAEAETQRTRGCWSVIEEARFRNRVRRIDGQF